MVSNKKLNELDDFLSVTYFTFLSMLLILLPYTVKRRHFLGWGMAKG